MDNWTVEPFTSQVAMAHQAHIEVVELNKALLTNEFIYKAEESKLQQLLTHHALLISQLDQSN